jgi:membrane peptidoglycan carboxypeptidase
VTARRDGSSPQKFPDREAPVRNSGGASCPACTLTEAITRSLNTTFYGLAYEVGPERVAETTRKATGLPDTWQGGADNLVGKTTLANPDTGVPGSAIGIGEYEMRPVDQAVGFATFANGGVRHAPYFVARVTDNEGAVLLENAGDEGEQVIAPDVANDVTYAIEGVADYSKRSLDGGRPVASKTGTVGSSDEDNSDAWMVGYTPSISTAVWMGSDGRDPIVDVRGRIIYGSGLPGAIWQEFMNTVLDGTPEEPLPSKPMITGDTGEGVPEPTPTPVPTPQAPAPQTTQAAPTETPVETQVPTETGQPTGTGSPPSTPAAGVPTVPGQPNQPGQPNPPGQPGQPGQPGNPNG